MFIRDCCYVNECADGGKQKIDEEIQKIRKAKVLARIFTFRELVVATDNFNPDCLIGEGGFGRVYQGYIESMDQVYMNETVFGDYILHAFKKNVLNLSCFFFFLNFHVGCSGEAT